MKRIGLLRLSKWAFLLNLCGFIMPESTQAYNINENLSAGGILVGVYQYQDLSEKDGVETTGRAAFLFQPEARFTPTKRDELFAKFGFAAGNGLREISPFALPSHGGDLEDDVKDINGRNRDYLLTAWYKHTFNLRDNTTIALTGGLIDSTDYLDDNLYGNDENTQFMNPVFVNAANAFFPSYDMGGVVELDTGNLSIRALGMAVGSNDDGNAFNFYGLQVGYTIRTDWGRGTYRFIPSFTSKDYLDPQGTNKERRESVVFSFDQELGDIFGGFLRFGWHDHKAAITYETLYSGGLNISGKAWGRTDDNAGVAYAYLEGGNKDLDLTQVLEAYARFQLNRFTQLTLDLQYMQDELRGGGGPKGLIYGIRLFAEF